MVRADAPVLVTLTDCGALVVPTICASKFKLDGVTDTSGGPAEIPVPDSATVLSPDLASLIIDNVPVSDPRLVGVKTTLTVHE